MAKSESNVDRLYDALRRMASDFAFKPEERINESALAARLNASRTPLREALNRLVAEGFLTFRSGRGFFCRPLSPEAVLDLYEARTAIECEAARLACLRASDAGLDELSAWLDRIAPDYTPETDTGRLLEMDEGFHRHLVALAGNAELARLADNLNDRIRYVRVIDLQAMRRGDGPRPDMMAAHRRILAALAARDAEAAAAAMRAHIGRRRDEAAQAVREAYARLYVPDFAGERRP